MNMLPQNQTHPDVVAQMMQRAIRSEVERIIEEESKAAGERVVKRIKERTAEIAAIVLGKFTMERFENKLVIAVDFGAELRK